MLHSIIFDAVTLLLGPPDDPGPEDFDLDAMMVFDAGDGTSAQVTDRPQTWTRGAVGDRLRTKARGGRWLSSPRAST